MPISFDYIIVRITYFVVFGLAFSWLLNHILLRFVKTLGMRNVEEIRWNAYTKPSIGGITFYIMFLLGLAYFGYLSQSTRIFSFQTMGFLGAISLAFMLGLFDDAYNTRPLLKAFTQLMIGVILIKTNNVLLLFSYPYLNDLFTLGMVFFLMNSFNMLDNMDGITASASLWAFVNILFCLMLLQEIFSVFTFISLAAITALISFLYFNKPPSRMYMGDTGSQFIGALAAALGIFIVNMINGESHWHHWMHVIYFLLLTFAVPVTDTLIVVFFRIKRRVPPYVGGKDHTTHHLVYKGWQEKQVFYFTFISAFLFNFMAWLGVYTNFSWMVCFTGIIFFLVYFIFMARIVFFNRRSPFVNNFSDQE